MICVIDELNRTATRAAMDTTEDVGVGSNVGGGYRFVCCSVDEEDVGVVGESESDLACRPGSELFDLIRIDAQFFILTCNTRLPSEETLAGECREIHRVSLVNVGHVESCT